MNRLQTAFLRLLQIASRARHHPVSRKGNRISTSDGCRGIRLRPWPECRIPIRAHLARRGRAQLLFFSLRENDPRRLLAVAQRAVDDPDFATLVHVITALRQATRFLIQQSSPSAA